MKRSPILLLSGLLALLMAFGCGENLPPVPRPPAFPRIDLPAHSYQSMATPTCPFTFDYPAIGKVESSKPDSCWMNLYFPDFECRWHITYRHIPSSGKSFAEHSEEYRRLVFKHIQKVSQIKETPLHSDVGDGILYELFGTVGVPAQLFFSDSTHIVLASFYFDTAVRNDSLAPVIDFMKTDMKHMAESIKFQ